MTTDTRSITEMLEARLRRELDPRERVLWQGQPLQGLRVGLIDLLVAAVTLVWLWHVLNWPNEDFARTGFSALSLFQVPFLVVGAYVCFGRFFFDAAVRKRTLYCLTEQRAIIITHFPTRRVRSVSLARIPEIQCIEGARESGAIVFGTRSLARRGVPRSPRFDAVPDVQRIYTLAQTAAHTARVSGCSGS